MSEFAPINGQAMTTIEKVNGRPRKTMRKLGLVPAS